MDDLRRQGRSPLLVKSGKSETVKVCVRCRPMNQKEIQEGHVRIVEMDIKKGVISIQSKNVNKDLGETIKQFTFDAVYDCNAKQTDIYDETVRPLVNSVLEGFNGTVFAYGQTGTGKTYTMEGIRNDECKKGIIPNAFEHIFNHIARSTNQQYLVRSSYLEIYQEEIRDLLAKDQNKRLELRERPDVGVYIKDLSSFVCKSIKEIEHVMTVGNDNRSVGATNMNEHSSRSHAIFIITIEHTSIGIDEQTHIRVGKLNLVDLAGSERQVKTGVSGQRQKEAIKINLSLSALGNVISSLIDGKNSHIPYRDSKLTRLLQDSLGGNSKTVMIANIGPASYNYEETLTTLRYASRAKNIKNRPRVNEDPKDALLREFQSEIDRLKRLLNEKKKKKEKKDEDIQVKDNRKVDQDATEKLAAKIKAMESKLLCGGKNIIDHTNEQQRELELRRQEIAEQKLKEREMLQRIEEQDESTLEIRETFTSMQQEVEIKKRKLRKLFTKLQSLKSEIQDSSEANSRERRELEEIQNELMKELKLKYLVIDNFIPVEDKNKFLSKVAYNEEDEDWKIMQVNNTEKCLFLRRPVLKCNSLNSNSRTSYFTENVMKMDLIASTKLTKKYKIPMMSPCIKEALETALKAEEEISIDVSAFTENSDRRKKKFPSNERPKTAFRNNNLYSSTSRPGTAAFLKRREMTSYLP